MALAWCKVCGRGVVGTWPSDRLPIADPVPCPACKRPTSLAVLRSVASDPLYAAHDYAAEIERMAGTPEERPA